MVGIAMYGFIWWYYICMVLFPNCQEMAGYVPEDTGYLEILSLTTVYSGSSRKSYKTL